jgi:hypothetical protein
LTFQYLYKKMILLLFISNQGPIVLQAMPGLPEKDSMEISSVQQAIVFLDSINHLDTSDRWPNVDPELFLLNLRSFAIKPLNFYEGKSTNFCSYSALTYFPLRYDPLGFSRFMINLYKNGTAKMGKVVFRPGTAIRIEAGLLRYKGALDVSPAGQMWFLCLADYFKGYLNFFNRHFDKGDENTLWAVTNFAKFNRMLRKLFYLKTQARGADLIRPAVGDRYSYLRNKLKEGIVFLYLNNRLLYKKKHVATRLGIPTHYVLLLDIYKTDDDTINIVYWDYGRKTLQQPDAKFLRQIIFGVTTCSFHDK